MGSGALRSPRRAAAHVYAEARSAEALALGNEVGTLKQELEHLRSNSAAARARKDASRSVAARRALEYGQVRMSIANIYRRCCSRSVIAHRDDLGPAQQLDAIACVCGDFGHVLKQHRAAAAAAAAHFAER